MKKLISISGITLQIFFLFTISSCFQYPEGPIFTLQTRDERIDGTWLLTSATDANGNDITVNYPGYTLSVFPNRSSDNSIISFFKEGSLYSQGTYQFASHGDQLIVIYSLYENNQGLAQIFYEIRKLTDKEFIFRDQSGYEFNWKKY